MKISDKEIMMGKNIVDILQDKVDKLKKKHWQDDICQPDFIVSLLYDRNIRNNKIAQHIILTCLHASSSVSSVIFPIDENFYGYDSILSAMNDLYNQTI